MTKSASLNDNNSDIDFPPSFNAAFILRRICFDSMLLSSSISLSASFSSVAFFICSLRSAAFLSIFSICFAIGSNVTFIPASDNALPKSSITSVVVPNRLAICSSLPSVRSSVSRPSSPFVPNPSFTASSANLHTPWDVRLPFESVVK